MPLEIRNNFLGGLDLDTSLFSIDKSHYIDALNITRDAVAGNQDLAITNIVGNRIVTYANYPGGRSKIINITPNLVRNTVIFFRWNSYGAHGIYELNMTTRTVTKILENLIDTNNVDILGFAENDKITSVNIYNRNEGDLLFFLDSLGRPTGFNITSMKNGIYTPVTRQIIDVAVNWPSQPPTCIYDNDNTKSVNYLINKLFKFQYIWVFDDFQQSACSPESGVPLPDKILDPTFANVITNNNVIRVQLASGPKNVKAIKLLMSFAYKENIWRDFEEVITIDKAEQGITDDTNFIFSFYNDSVYPIFDVTRRIQLFDDVPQLANCQEMPNGNILTYAGITEGYDNNLNANVVITINTILAGGGGAVGSLNAVSTFRFHTSGRDHWQTVFSGVPAVGTVITIQVTNKGTSLPDTFGTYTTIAGDSSATVTQKMYLSMLSIGLASELSTSGSTLFWTWNTNDYKLPVITTVTPPASAAASNSIATWPFLSTRNIGLVYFDEKGRTNGVIYNQQIIFPNWVENGLQQVFIPYINAKIYHVPPDWAYSFAWVVTKDESDYVYIETVDVNSTESTYVYFDITNLGLNQTKNPTTAAVVSWTFQDGDRVRLIRRMSDGFVYGPSFDANVEGIVVAPTISGVAQTGKTFVKIKKVAPFAAEDYSSDFFILQLYRRNPNATVTDTPFFEFGENYQIIDPTLSTRRHSGSVSDQSADYVTPAEFNMYNGDAYFRVRNEYLSESGIGTFNVQDRNFIDNYISAVNGLDGRPNAIDPNARRAYYSTLIRFGGQYSPDTNINELNQFKDGDFDEYDYSWGDIQRIKVKDRYIRVFQKLKCGLVPIFSQITKNAIGNEVTVTTDKLLNPIQYYVGEYGIGDAKESLASFMFADYFCDTKRGAILRLSNDGIIPISVKYKVNSWATDEIPKRTGNHKIYGAFDQRSNNYIAALEATDTEDASTISFDEETNAFESFLSYHPESMATFGTILITAKDGDIYTHDNASYNIFYGINYESNISVLLNENAIQKKSWQSISTNSNVIWDCPLIYTNMNTYGSQRQETNLIANEFAILEGMPSSAIKRDQHSSGGKINGGFIKGNYLVIKFRRIDASSLIYLSSVNVKYVNSPLTPV